MLFLIAIETGPRRAHAFVISVWADPAGPSQTVWRGALITAARQRVYFSSLAELNSWLAELAGWQDPPAGGPPETGQAPTP